MNTFQIIFISLIVIYLALKVKKMIMEKGIKNYSPAIVSNKINTDKNVVLLDVRTDSERKSRSIKGSIHIPLQELSGRIGELEKYKNREIICYCHSGARSASATAMLIKNGFNAANMSGGISAWNY